MTEFFESALLDLGPQVAIIDDLESEAIPLSEALTRLSIGNQFIKVDLADPKYPESPLHNVELIFLDLYYDDNYGADFEPYICCDILGKVVPQGKKYVLVIWSKDINKTKILLPVMKERNLTMPVLIETKAKEKYQKDYGYDIETLLDELRVKLNSFEVNTQDFVGEIIDVNAEQIVINCLLKENPSFFEIRKFDRELFGDLYDLSIGKFLNIRVTTRPGERNITFVPEEKDLSDKFKKPDAQPEDLSWLNDPDDEDNL